MQKFCYNYNANKSFLRFIFSHLCGQNLFSRLSVKFTTKNCPSHIEICGISATRQQQRVLTRQMLERPSTACEMSDHLTLLRSRFNASQIDIDGGKLSYFLLFFSSRDYRHENAPTTLPYPIFAS